MISQTFWKQVNWVVCILVCLAVMVPGYSAAGAPAQMNQPMAGDSVAISLAASLEGCEALYPIALSEDSLKGVETGQTIADIYNGTRPGNFGWLTWAGVESEEALAESLTPPGNAGSAYTNPNDPADHVVSLGDWVPGRPGVANSRHIRTALDALKQIDITVPVWDQTSEQGSQAAYHVTAFVIVRLTDYTLPNENRITARYLGYDHSCPGQRLPIASDDEYQIDEDVVLTVAAPGVLANDTDPDNDALTARVETSPAHGTLALSPDGAFTYTPEPNFNGADTFTYVANDGRFDSNTATVRITVIPVNDPPVAADDAYTTDEDISISMPGPGVLGNDTDPDGDALTAALVTPPAHGTLQLAADGSFVYTPSANYNGPDGFTYQACDTSGACSTAGVTISIAAVNDPPTAVDDTYFAFSGKLLTVAAPGVLKNDSDVDGDPLQAKLASGPLHGTLQLNSDGSFTYTASAAFIGQDSFTYLANDGKLDSAAATVTINVAAPLENKPPVAVNDSYTLPQSATLNVAAPGVLANDTDPDGDTLTAILVKNVTNGTLTLRPDGSFSYISNSNSCAGDSFTYMASDGKLTSNTATVVLGGASNYVDLQPDLTWGRSKEGAGFIPSGATLGSAVPAGLALAIDPNQVVFDNGTFTAAANKKVVPAGVQWTSWPYPGDGRFYVRKFETTFTIPADFNLANICDVSLFNPYYNSVGKPNVVPINDNLYVYLNGSQIGKKGTKYPGSKNEGYGGTAPFANETDGWWVDGSFGSAAASFLHTGSNVLTIVTEEYNDWGGMARLDLRLRSAGTAAPVAKKAFKPVIMEAHWPIVKPRPGGYMTPW